MYNIILFILLNGFDSDVYITINVELTVEYLMHGYL